MRSFSYSYKSSNAVQEKVALSCASAVLLTLVSWPHASAHAQSMQQLENLESPKLELTSPLTKKQEEIKQTEKKVQPQQSPEEQKQTLILMQQKLEQAQKDKEQLLKKDPSQMQKEIKETKEKLTPEQQKQLVLMQQLQLEKLQTQTTEKLEKVPPSSKTMEEIKQTEKKMQSQQLTPEQQKQLVLTQEKQQLLEQPQLQTPPSTPSQLLQTEIKKTLPTTELQQPVLPQKVIPQTTLNNPANPIATVEQKYQKLLDAGVFSSSAAPVNLDATMTRAEFAAVMAKLQTLSTQPRSTQFAEIGTSFSTGVAATKLGLIEGVSSESKSSATLADVIKALSKNGLMDSADAEQLIAKEKTNAGAVTKADAIRTVTPAVNVETIRVVNNVVGEIVPTFSGAATTAGIGGLSSGSLASLALALSAAASAAAASASSSANEITLENAANPSANYTVVLPRSSWPTSLNATYNGRLSGTLSDSSAVGGNLTMNVNFATIRSGTPIAGNVLFDNGKGSASFNSVGAVGSFVGGGMNGTYNGQAMTGFIRNGQFFGPAAEAVKGSWDMSTSSVSGGGTFAATR